MSTHVTQSQSQTLNPISRGNGQVSNQPPISTDRKYKLEDFSQQAINRGQVEINFLLTVVNGRVDDALKVKKCGLAISSLRAGRLQHAG
jgi:hypothetical protein